MANEDVTIVIEVDSKQAQKQLAKINVSLKKTGTEAKKTGNEIEKSFKGSAIAAAGLAVAVAAIGKGFQFVISEAIKIEDLETQLIAFTGSAAGAAEQIERLAEFAGSTPFQLDELARANRTLLAFGSTAEGSIEELRQLGEASAATGADIGELARIFGQIDAAGKLTGERFLQLVERGINIGPTLAKSLGVAESSLEDLRQKGQISSEDVKKAFETLANTQYAGSLERQSKTLSGSIGILEDNTKRLAASLGKILTPFLVSTAKAATELVKEFNQLFQDEKSDTLSGRIKEIDTALKLAELNAGDLRKKIEDLNNTGKELDLKKALSVGKDLRKTNDQIEKLTQDYIRLRQAQQLSTGRDQQAAEAKKEAEELRKLEAEKKDIRDASEKERLENVAKLEAELAVIREQASAVELVAEESKNAALVEQLDQKRELILQKESEKNVALLEAQGQFEVAAEEQAKESLRRIEDAEKDSQDKRKAQAAKDRSEEFDFEKQNAKAKLKFEQETWQQRAQSTKTGLDALSNLRNSGNREAFEIGKAAAIAQTLIETPLAAQRAYTSLAAFPPLAAAAAAAAVAAGVGRVNQIRSQKFTAFADGGVVPGIGNSDSVPSLLTPGEIVIPERDFASLNLNGRDPGKSEELVRQVQETNGLLREVIRVSGTVQSEGFLEEKFSSSTPGGIFYEPVDDGESERDKREAENVRNKILANSFETPQIDKGRARKASSKGRDSRR